MSSQNHIYLIGDQTANIFEGFQDLLRDRSDPIVQSFLDQVYFLLRAECAKVKDVQAGALPRFSSLADLLLLRRDGTLHSSLDQALACAFQIATFMSRCGKSGGLYPQPSDSYVVGLCTGAISASAICSSRTLTELLPAGVEAVAVAFKTGLLAGNIANFIEKPVNLGRTNSWSSVFAGLGKDTAEEKLKNFFTNNAIPPLSRPFVSAVTENNVTITAPPSVLASLKASPDFSNFQAVTLPLQVPYHGEHLFTQQDITTILDSVSSDFCSKRESFLPLLSGHGGNVIWAGTFRSLLDASLRDILLNPIRWDVVAPRVAKSALAGSRSVPIVHPLATNLSRSLMKIVQNEARSTLSGESDGPDFSYGQPNASSAPFERKSDLPTGTAGSKIAIVGMSGRFPGGGESTELFWDLLRKGVDTHKVVPARSWNVETHTDPTMKRKNTAATPYGCWLDHPDLFDSKFFYISPREAPQVDPAQRLALMTAYEAIEQAGIVPDGSPSTQKDRVGIFYGCTSQDWMETNSPQNIDTFYIPGGNRAFIPGRINYFFKFSGPSLSLDTACSSSLAAINTACLSLWRGDTDCAIAGGTNVLTNPDPTAGLDRGHFLSRTGNCKTFDDGADGYCRAEGAATVILKRLEDAIAENDPIQGVICGAFTNHSAEAESITRPHVGAQRDIFRKIMNQAGVDPYDVSYVEMHGTGTQAGDAAEMSSVLDVFAPKTMKPRREDQALYLGSAKANIGHGESVSGVTSLCKVLMMLRKQEIPPHIGIKTKINHRFPTDLADRNVRIADKPLAWNWPKDKKVFINNFSAAGGNSAILVEQAPELKALPEGVDPRSTHIIALSAQSAPSLKANLEGLKDHISKLAKNENTLAQLSYTTTARRMHHMHRYMVHGTSLEEIQKMLQVAIDNNSGSARIRNVPGVVFAFTGQGSQYIGMGKQLMDQVPSFKSDIERYDQLAISQGFPSFKQILTMADGDANDFAPTAVQLSIVCLEMALVRLWRSWGVGPSAVVGHSLGEYAALNAAGVLSDSDTIYLVGSRAQLLERNCTQGSHCMLAVKSSAENLASRIAGSAVEIACINGPEDVVLSGRVAEIQKIQKTLQEAKLKATLLKVAFAFHSSQVDPFLQDFEKICNGVRFNDPNVPVLCPLTGEVSKEGKSFAGAYLAQHCRKQVNMFGAIKAAESQGLIKSTSIVLEFGPQPVVSGMFKSTVPSITTLASLRRGGDAWSLIAPAVTSLYNEGVTGIKFGEYHQPFPHAHRVLELNTYAWNLQSYWMQYEYDWSLRKGDPPLTVEAGSTPPKQMAAVEKPKTAPKPSSTSKEITLQTTSVHRVAKEEISSSGGPIITESNIASKELAGFVGGHVVNGVPLCTPSVYCDIALSIGKYIRDKYHPDWTESLVEVADMVVERALVARQTGPQYLRAVGAVDFASKSITMGFHSADAEGNLLAKHAQGVIRFKDRSVINDYSAQAKAAYKRIGEMYSDLVTGDTLRFNKKMAYRAVSELATFDPDHQAVTEVVLDSNKMESSSTVNLVDVKHSGDFHTHPAFIDNLSQAGGFVMNCNEGADLTKNIFVNHGWHSFLEFEKLDPSKTYKTHVQMKEGKEKLWEGDVLVFEGDKLVAIFGRVLLQGVPRRLMNMILSQESGSKAPSKQVPKSQPSKSVPAPAPKVDPTPKPSQASVPAATPKAPTPTPAPKAHAVSKPAPKRVTKPTTSPLVGKVMAIIAEESGIETEEWNDDSHFSDMGVDSLILTIVTGRIMEELDLDIDSHTFLEELPSVKHLKTWIIANAPGGDDAVDDIEDNEQPVEDDSEEELAPAPVPETNSAPTPVSTSEPTPSAPPATVTMATTSSAADFEPILKIISEESGVPVEELHDDAVFADVGIDSLLSVLIAGRCQEELDLEVDSNSLFIDVMTIRDLKSHLAPLLGVSEPAPIGTEEEGAIPDGPVRNVSISQLSQFTEPETIASSDEEERDGTSTPATSDSGDSIHPEIPQKPRKQSLNKRVRIPIPDEQVPRTTSVLLQGRPRAGVKNLFLFPDGSGSASSYKGIHKLTTNVALIGLNCPYVRNPEDMACTLDQMIASFLDEIRRRQPVGPYTFGGWSAGGVLAYRAAQELIREGETVDDLVLLDSPEPIGLDKLPQRFVRHLEDHGLWSEGGKASQSAPPKRVTAHFDAIMDLLCDYYADPLPEGYAPRVSILWATECLLDGVRMPKLDVQGDEVEDMKFLTEKRTDFSAGQWGHMFPGADIYIEKAEGVDHFEMINDRDGLVAKFIERATKE